MVEFQVKEILPFIRLFINQVGKIPKFPIYLIAILIFLVIN
jgi:hypothetical protein